MTPNVVNSPVEGQPQQAGTLSNFFINPPITPPISDTSGNIRTALIDQLAGFQISLFQHLFPVPQNPNLQKTTFSDPGGSEQLQAILIDINNIKSTIYAINQITNTPANRIPANASIDTNPPYNFLDSSVMTTCNNIVLAIIENLDTLSAQRYYPTLVSQLNPIYGY